MIKIAVVLEPCEEGGFTASVPTIPGCFSEGETVQETLHNISEAIELILEAVEDDLVVEESAIVKELIWHPDARRPEVEPADDLSTPPAEESSPALTSAAGAPRRVRRRAIEAGDASGTSDIRP